MKRRTLLKMLPVAAAAVGTTGGIAMAQSALSLEAFGISANSGGDQSAELQLAMNEAARQGLALFLPGGTYRASGLELPSNLMLRGVPGASVITLSGTAILAGARDAKNINIEGVTFANDGGESENLLSFYACANLTLRDVGINNPKGNGARLEVCSGSVESCTIKDCGLTGLHAQNSAGLMISGNRISDCGSGGLRVWRYENGRDGTIVTNNQISGIMSPSGNGQNGNGINAFRADEIIISNNVISDCDFSAVRVNGTTDAVITGNVCSQIREICVFSEFAFSGSVIANNIIDEAAAGISITNFDHDGRLAACSGNLIRNIWRSSPTNPENGGFGISAQAEVAVSGNVVEAVDGIGINAGWGPYLRNVNVDGNVIRDTEIGISVTVVEDAGLARITNNIISGARQTAIAGRRWRETVGNDIATEPDQFANVIASGNSVS